ncbi:PREDICTED: uncharacterized protein LOC104602522 isoform X2 [Nelumbo nucifera]|uniref:Uncharacterized protein LOC104602522 isoform X2 n=1 Tax=Nelumbo nucifera TaxID=4432 RepID=A0A1U8ANX4_NELNU|nr:PREDICTED: uncharacterized protein LOC104602522 isoform X2 [Nelumbo nucifera]
MAIRGDLLKKWVLMITFLYWVSLNNVSAVCELSVVHRDGLYNFSLASPTQEYPHGVLSEDGFYKVAVNETVLWFQDCGGPSRCGMKCSALVANNIGGYHVCTTIGKASSVNVNLIDREDPQKGVNVRMSSSGSKGNCSLTVSVFCDSNGVEGPYSLEKSGTCDYATILKHPAGCAKIISVHRRGWGWLGTIITIILCLLGGYLLVGAVYRFFFLGIRGIEVIPNLEFWLSLPQRTKSLLGSLVRKFRGPSRGYRSSYSPVNF